MRRKSSRVIPWRAGPASGYDEDCTTCSRYFDVRDGTKRRLWPVRALQRFDKDGHRPNHDRTDNHLRKTRISERHVWSFAAILRGGDSASCVRMMLMIIRIFRRYGV